MTHRLPRGFSLIELMIGLVIAATLLVLAAPNYAVWAADGQIRAAAESIASGLRYAQAEAIKRNAPVEFVLDPTTGSGGWQARVLSDGTQLQVDVFAEGSVLAAFTTNPASATITTFSSFGGVLAPPDVATAPIQTILVTFSGTVANTRPLMVLVGGGRTGIKICDPAVSDTTSPRFCTT